MKFDGRLYRVDDQYLRSFFHCWCCDSDPWLLGGCGFDRQSLAQGVEENPLDRRALGYPLVRAGILFLGMEAVMEGAINLIVSVWEAPLIGGTLTLKMVFIGWLIFLLAVSLFKYLAEKVGY